MQANTNATASVKRTQFLNVYDLIVGDTLVLSTPVLMTTPYLDIFDYHEVLSVSYPDLDTAVIKIKTLHGVETIETTPTERFLVQLKSHG